MKYLFAIILTLLVGAVDAFCEDGAGSTVAAEKMDSLSYAYGYQFTIATMAGKNDLLKSKEDLGEFIRGLEENPRNLSQMCDSSYMISYTLGAMEAIFMTDGIHHKKKEELPPFQCIIAGLRRVADGTISLPADTVAAMQIINRLVSEGANPLDVEESAKCLFFTAYGTMKAYQPGLQEYVNGIIPGTACIENREAYASGMADVLEAYTEPPKTAYDLGRSIGFSLSLTSMEDSPVDFPSFVAGAKASLGLGEQILSRDQVEEIFSREFGQQMAVSDETDYDTNFEKIAGYIEKLEIEPFHQYRVDWKVTAASVAETGAIPTVIFENVMSQIGISEDMISGYLMAISCDGDGHIYEAMSKAIMDNPLPEGFKWFSGRTEGLQTTIGIMQTAQRFMADVHEASVDYDTGTGMVNVQWVYNPADALKWAEFTESAIGRNVAVEIDGRFMFAPRVNQQITGGRCAISDLSPEEINRLFKGAEKMENPKFPEPIEVIELQ